MFTRAKATAAIVSFNKTHVNLFASMASSRLAVRRPPRERCVWGAGGGGWRGGGEGGRGEEGRGEGEREGVRGWNPASFVRVTLVT